MSIFKRVKISQLPAAGSAQAGDVYPTVQGGETRKQTQAAVVQSAEQTAANALLVANNAQGDATQALLDASAAQIDATQALGDAAAAQVDATAALSALPSKSDKAEPATGNVSLVTSEIHGSRANPNSGANITVNINGAELDSVSRVYHQAAAAPTINVSGSGAGNAVKFGEVVYNPAKVNIFAFWYDGNGNVNYALITAE
jgi:hypothetical protein